MTSGRQIDYQAIRMRQDSMKDKSDQEIDEYVRQAEEQGLFLEECFYWDGTIFSNLPPKEQRTDE